MSPPDGDGGPDTARTATATTNAKQAVDVVEPTGYTSAFPVYHRLGWPSPLPLPARAKKPVPKGYTGRGGGVPSYPDMQAWSEDERYRGGNLCLRLAPGVIGIDIDDYDGKGGGATIAEAERRWGPLPPSYSSTSRGSGVSGIRLYRIPEGVELQTVLGFPELALGGVEIIQHHHRYVICWPSRHDKSGETYRWYADLDGGETTAPPAPSDIPDLPEAWLHGLTVDPLREPACDGPELGSESAAAVRACLTEGEPSQRVAFKLGEALAALYGASRHDHTRDAVLGLLRCGKQREPGVRRALNGLSQAYATVVGPDRPGGHAEALADFKRFINDTDRVAALLADPDYDDDGAQALGGAITSPENGRSVGRPWQPVDLDLVLSGDWQPPTPSVGRRSDGVGEFYPGKVHTIASESEAGKTWMALAAATEELRQGNSVAYFDFEDDEGGVVGRLLTLQVGPEVIREHFHYVRPTEALGGGINLDDLRALVTSRRPVLVIIDGVTEAMTMHGLNPLDNEDIATFGRILPRRLANAGPAVVCLDHVVKAVDARGRYALGGVHKLNGLDGAAYILENREPFGIGLTGRSTILIAKDRPGQLRKHGHRRKDGLHVFAELVLTSHHSSYTEYEIRPDGPTVLTEEFMPTTLMTKISEALAEHGAMTQRQILATVKGKRQYAIDALALLQRDGYVSEKSPHERLKPYPDAAST